MFLVTNSVCINNISNILLNDTQFSAFILRLDIGYYGDIHAVRLQTIALNDPLKIQLSRSFFEKSVAVCSLC